MNYGYEIVIEKHSLRYSRVLDFEDWTFVWEVNRVDAITTLPYDEIGYSGAIGIFAKLAVL